MELKVRKKTNSQTNSKAHEKPRTPDCPWKNQVTRLLKFNSNRYSRIAKC